MKMKSYKILQKVLLFFYEKVMMRTDPKHPELVKEDSRIPPYNEIGEKILEGIQELTESRDVLFKWNGEKSTDKSIATSARIIEAFKKLPEPDQSQLGNDNVNQFTSKL